MSESKFETVSSLVDSYQANDDVLNEIVKDNHLSATWQNYHLIGDVMRDEVGSTLNIDLSAEIANAIADEPTVLAPVAKTSFTETVKAKVIQFAKPFGQMAIAASAAGLMVMGVQQNVADNEILTPSQIVQTNPLGGIAEPVSLNFQQNTQLSQQQALVQQQRRFQALLQDHNQQIKFTAVSNDAVEVKKEAEEKVK
jgi:sigma-E factor negative regulatory protein RseA